MVILTLLGVLVKAQSTELNMADNSVQYREGKIIIDTINRFFLNDSSLLLLERVEIQITNSVDSAGIIVFEDGFRHRKGVVKGHPRKDEYKPGDHIMLLEKYEFEIVGIDNDTVVLRETNSLTDIVYTNNAFNYERYLGKKKYIFIYEWSADDKQSVELLPVIRKLYKDYKNKVAFLGVCKTTADRKKEAKKIWEQNKPGFKTLYIDNTKKHVRLPEFIFISHGYLNLLVQGSEYLHLVEEELQQARERDNFKDDI